MDVMTLVRSITLFLVFAVTLGMNLDDNLIARLGMTGNYGLVVLLAILFTLFLTGRHVLVAAAAVCLCLIANLPADFTLNFGYDRDYYAALMLAVVFQPILARILH